MVPKVIVHLQHATANEGTVLIGVCWNIVSLTCIMLVANAKKSPHKAAGSMWPMPSQSCNPRIAQSLKCQSSKPSMLPSHNQPTKLADLGILMDAGFLLVVTCNLQEGQYITICGGWTRHPSQQVLICQALLKGSLPDSTSITCKSTR